MVCPVRGWWFSRRTSSRKSYTGSVKPVTCNYYGGCPWLRNTDFKNFPCTLVLVATDWLTFMAFFWSQKRLIGQTSSSCNAIVRPTKMSGFQAAPDQTATMFGSTSCERWEFRLKLLDTVGNAALTYWGVWTVDIILPR